MSDTRTQAQHVDDFCRTATTENARAVADFIRTTRVKLEAVISHIDDVDKGTTHWEGCEDVHPRCALRRLLDDNKYQKAATRTMNTGLSKTERLSMLSMGLAGEAGEVVDYLKKVIYHSHTFEKDVLSKELGDVLWYIANLCTECDFAMSDVMEANITKLKARYPEGFDPDRSKVRTEPGEPGAE